MKHYESGLLKSHCEITLDVTLVYLCIGLDWQYGHKDIYKNRTVIYLLSFETRRCQFLFFVWFCSTIFSFCDK